MKKAIFLLTGFLLIILLPSIFAEDAQLSNQGLIAYYSFDEGASEILHDRSGNNHDGTIHGATWVKGFSGNALEFNGVDNYVSLPISIIGNWDALTYSAWIKLPEYSGLGWPGIIGSTTTSYSNNNNLAISRNSACLHLEIDTDSGNYEFQGKIPISWDTWIHAVLVYDGSNLIEYVNGEQGNSIPAGGNLKTVTELNIGQHSRGLYFLSGQIDEIFIYNRALSPVEVNQLFNHDRPVIPSTLFKENNAIEKSPLSIILPKETVPLVATIISVTTIGLWQLFGSMIIEFFSNYSSERIIDFRENTRGLSSRFNKVRIPFMPLSAMELFNIFIAVIVFSIALSWTWGSSVSEILSLFLLNIVIIGIIYIFRELLRVHYSSKLHIRTYHNLWPFGTILTIISSFLGNTFSLASYNTAENEDDGRYAQILFNSNIIFYSIATVTFIMNLLVPHVIFQMIFIFLIMTLTIGMTPLKPMDGDIIRKWNTKKFMTFYLIILVSYVFMIFIM
jgi:hypothetical protein